ncbi:MAG: glycosyltransferase [Anaerolineales bacterium]|nr:glycosyltransferase [Anaerolineales bacterium]
MRLGQLTDCYLPVINGVTSFVRLFKRTLAEMGAEPYVFTSGYPNYADDEPNVLRSPGVPMGSTGYYAYLNYSAHAWELVNTMDVLHVHHPLLAASLARRVSRRRGQPVIFTSHTRYDLYAHYYLPFLPARTAAALMAAWMRHVARGFDLILAVSAAAETMLRAMRVTAPIEVIPNGIALEPYTRAWQAGRGDPAARAALGLPAAGFVAMYVGRLGLEKNLPLLLDAFEQARRQAPEAVLALVGGGPLEAELRRAAQRPGLAGAVHFLGRRPNEAIPALVANADAFVTASVTEGHPIAVIEALAAGLPVVALDVPGIRETISSGENGRLASPGPDAAASAAALGATLAEVARAPTLRQALSDGARASAQQYSIQATTRRILDSYKALLRERGRSAQIILGR